ncbi:MAG: CRISPR-associated helicase Cas3' [Clostridiales bacterium]|nr:CRISPR-associated helicase Cas3' [Clostridiales bacterium]MCF8023305.1 CRISPR-associated helicase Cas3' [Clostridiales bacterium]
MLAKTKPIKTIKKHSLEVVEEAENLSLILQNHFDRRLFELLKIAAMYHDIGKASKKFQIRIYNNIRRMLEGEVPHNYLSSCMLRSDLGLSAEEELMVVFAIAYHHSSSHEFDLKLTLNNLKEIEKEKEYIREKMGIDFEIRKDCIKKLNKNSLNIQNLDQYIILKGLLQRIDYAASAELNVETGWKESINQKTTEYMQNNGLKINDLQNFVLNNKDKNIMVIGQTGVGKTESALLWAGEDKMFFTLPIRVSSNAIYDRAKKMQINSTGLVHSTSLDYLEEYEVNFQKIYQESRLLSKKLTISTIDQIMKFPMFYLGFERELATLTYSKVVVDEIQSYDPDIVALLIKGLEIINKMGGKFYVMTATLPTIYKNEITNRIPDVVFDEFIYDNKLRHRINMNDSSILYAVDEIKKASSKGKVLVIVNTVKRAIEIYNKFKETNVNILHAYFTREHRSELERQIIDFSNSGDKGIWITTQIVEASLDIDFDFLFTEVAPLDTLFQRLGRCYRNRSVKDEKINVHVFVKDISGYGTVYGNLYKEGKHFVKDGFLIDQSIKMLQKYRDLKESDKVKMINKLYTKEMLERQKNKIYLTQFYETLKWLDDMHSNIYKNTMPKAEAQKRLRKLNTINIVPECYLTQIQNLLQQLQDVSTEQEKRKIKKMIDMRTVNVQDYSTDTRGDRRIRGKEKINEKLNLYRIPGSSYNYNDKDKSGLIL